MLEINEDDELELSKQWRVGWKKRSQISMTQKKDFMRNLNISSAEVKRRTGFKTKTHMFMFISSVCNGDMSEMVSTTSHLKWFDEWFLYFETMWGRTLTRWEDVASEYELTNHNETKVFEHKLQKVLRCRNSWPKCMRHHEDVLMRSDKWKGIVGDDERVVQHDGTCIRLMYKPSTPDNQRLTWAKYYAGNVAKASVFVQLGGWMGGDHCGMGSISDSNHVLKNKILETQEKFQNEDRVGEHILPFTIFLDRGYHLNLQAYRCGGQIVRQPSFLKGNRRFYGREMLRSASVANIRSGNERAVRKAKLAGFIRKGLRAGESPRRLDDAFLAWTFQCNFMYQGNM